MSQNLPIPAEGWQKITCHTIAKAMHIEAKDVKIVNDTYYTDAIFVLGEHFGDMDYMAGINGDDLQSEIDHFYKTHPGILPEKR